MGCMDRFIFIFICGCNVRSLILRKNIGLKALGNRVLRTIFGSMRVEVMAGWRTLHNEELHNLYSSSNIIRIIKLRTLRWEGYVACMVEMRNAYTILISKSEEKRPLGYNHLELTVIYTR
jgi:hypothetical protein